MSQGALFDPREPSGRSTIPPRSALPAHVRRRLEADGVLDPEGFTRAVRVGGCRRCSAEVLRGLDGDVCAIPAVADAIEVDVIGEALAIAARRMRWWLGEFPNAKRELEWQLVPRGQSHIGKPARGPVFIEHRCNAPPPQASLSRFPIPRRQFARDYPDEPPF